MRLCRKLRWFQPARPARGRRRERSLGYRETSRTRYRLVCSAKLRRLWLGSREWTLRRWGFQSNYCCNEPFLENFKRDPVERRWSRLRMWTRRRIDLELGYGGGFGFRFEFFEMKSWVFVSLIYNVRKMRYFFGYFSFLDFQESSWNLIFTRIEIYLVLSIWLLLKLLFAILRHHLREWSFSLLWPFCYIFLYFWLFVFVLK